MNHQEFKDFEKTFTDNYQITNFSMSCSFNEFDTTNIPLIETKCLTRDRSFGIIDKFTFLSDRFKKPVQVKLYTKDCQIIGTDQQDCLDIFYIVADILKINVDETIYKCNHVCANVVLSHDKTFDELNVVLSKYLINNSKEFLMIALNKKRIMLNSKKAIIYGNSYIKIQNQITLLCELIGNCQLDGLIGPKFANKN